MRSLGRRRPPSTSARRSIVATGEAADLLRELAPRIAESITRHRRAADRAAGGPRARRLPPRPGAHRAGWLPDRRLRGRAAELARGRVAPIDRRCATWPRCCGRSTTSRGARVGARRRPTAGRWIATGAGPRRLDPARARAVPRGVPGGLLERRVVGRHRPGPAPRLRGRQGAVRVRLRRDVPAVVAVRADRGHARAVRGRPRDRPRHGAARRHRGRPGRARPAA